MSDQPATAARPCSSCGRVRAECRTPDQPFLSCCNDCRANDGDTHSAPKGEVCTGPCDHDGHERRGPTWFGWYEPATAAQRPPDPGMSECCGATEASGHKPWCITVLGYWRWLLFGWRHRG